MLDIMSGFFSFIISYPVFFLEFSGILAFLLILSIVFSFVTEKYF